MAVCCQMMIRFPVRTNPNIFAPWTHQCRATILPKSLKMAAAAATPARTGSTKRPVCPSCSKPARICLCTRMLFPGIENPVGITILQHSLEKKHPLNSTRIVKLGLKNVTVATVSDVIFDARFSVWLLEKDSGIRNAVECTGFSEGIETENTQNQIFQFLDGENTKSEIESSENNPEEKNPNLGGEKGEVGHGNDKDGAWRAKHSKPLPKSGISGSSTGGQKKPVIDVLIGKKGVISSIEHIWMSHIHQQSPSFDDILSLECARNVLSKGFVVRKLQNREVNQSMELQKYEEFELTVPPGSVLLFPTDSAQTIGELKESGFEVKNVIVLDGTWLKARRMYSENPWLRFLPHLKLDPQGVSLYGEVRSQPKAGCLSTLESIVYTLKEIGHDTEGLDNLLDVFGSMVNDQRRCKDERLIKENFERDKRKRDWQE